VAGTRIGHLDWTMPVLHALSRVTSGGRTGGLIDRRSGQQRSERTIGLWKLTLLEQASGRWTIFPRFRRLHKDRQ
jgi:hypothetical protein